MFFQLLLFLWEEEKGWRHGRSWNKGCRCYFSFPKMERLRATITPDNDKCQLKPILFPETCTSCQARPEADCRSPSAMHDVPLHETTVRFQGQEVQRTFPRFSDNSWWTREQIRKCQKYWVFSVWSLCSGVWRLEYPDETLDAANEEAKTPYPMSSDHLGIWPTSPRRTLSPYCGSKLGKLGKSHSHFLTAAIEEGDRSLQGSDRIRPELF
jgi:hypothetical protein